MYLNDNNRKSIDDFKMILQSVSQYDEMIMNGNSGTHGTNGMNGTSGMNGLNGLNGTYDKQSSKATTESNNEELDYSIFDDERSWSEDMCRIQ